MLGCRQLQKTVWVYRVFWAKIETKPQEKIHTRLKQFFLFIYLFIYYYYYYYPVIIIIQTKKKKKKNQRENLFIFLYFIFYIFYPFFEKTNYYYLFTRTKLGVDTLQYLLWQCVVVFVVKNFCMFLVKLQTRQILYQFGVKLNFLCNVYSASVQQFLL